MVEQADGPPLLRLISVTFVRGRVENLDFVDTHVGVASGYAEGYGADALAGGPLEGKEMSPMLITRNVDNPDLLQALQVVEAERYSLAAPLIDGDVDFGNEYQRADPSFREAFIDASGAPTAVMTTPTGKVELAPPAVLADLDRLRGALDRDHDGDGFGNANSSSESCEIPDGSVSDGTETPAALRRTARAAGLDSGTSSWVGAGVGVGFGVWKEIRDARLPNATDRPAGLHEMHVDLLRCARLAAAWIHASACSK